ncbi:hypothetical protein TRFO_30611 [Tritrichomonas foetus]|uniref:SMP-LTD domain-containing protein n=1 Tax=Tritrichomonas foetus TaxID=1144522 RepID=A0A1J4JT39_9EUKA|nr:hypothetical protein TRFO_30611 [Tritrichomonas foetus]|eukprot:OHT02289.1 hypothetical protein TRFO_30611 [Tritrichomonas foetus]
MSLQFDWAALTPFIAEKVRSIITNLPPTFHPMLESKIRLRGMTLGDEPPHVALSKIISLHLNEQEFALVLRYNGNAEFELEFNLNVNALGSTDEYVQSSRLMGLLYTDTPTVTKCRFLASAFEITVKVEVVHGKESYMKFTEPPIIRFNLDSNLSRLGPIFEGGLRKVMKVTRRMYEKVPEKIMLDLP